MPAYFTTTRTSRKSKKRKKTASLLKAEAEHAKFLKRMGIGSRSSVGSEQQPSKLWGAGSSPAGITNRKDVGVGTQGGLINLSAADYRSREGSIPSASTNSRSVGKSGNPPHLGCGDRRFESSRSDQVFYDPSMAKKEEKVYTGTEIMGIAQMHKSNAVPIRNKKSAEEVAKMRRG